MSVPHVPIENLLIECEQGTGEAITVNRDLLKSILIDYRVLRRGVVSKSKQDESKIEERLKYIEGWCKTTDKGIETISSQMENFASRLRDLELGVSRVYGMPGGESYYENTVSK